MNNVNRYRKDRSLRERTFRNGVKLSDVVTYNDSENEVFSFTGFGKNGKPPYKVPTAGEYTKQRLIKPQGSFYHSERWYSTLNEDTRDGDIQYLSWGSWTDLQSSYDGTVYNRALEKFYENIRKSDVNLALTIGEARETGRMLGVGRSLADIVTLARRAKRQVLMNPSKTISEVWLSYKYGWQPLMNDIYGYTKWTYDLLNEGVPIIGRARRREPLYRVLNTTDPLRSKAIKQTTYGTREWRCEVKVWAGVSDSTWYNASRISSLNPLSIAWELVPLSFVADWFVDIGGYLQMMEGSLGTGLTFKRGYATEIYWHNLSQDWSQNVSWGTPGYDQQVQKINATGSQLYVKKRRTKLTAFPRPNFPRFSAKLGAQRIMSAASLIRTILLGRVSGRRV